MLGWINKAFSASDKAASADAAEACKNRGNEHLARGELEAAAACYRDAIAADPRYAEAHNNLGLVFLEQGSMSAAISSFEKAIALKPALTQARINLGNALKTEGRLDEAQACLSATIALAGDLPEAQNCLGAIILAQGKPAEAAAAFRRAIARRPDFAAAYFNLALALEAQGDLVGANANLEQALALDPRHADAHNSRGCLLKTMGRLDEARSSFEKALVIQPNHPAAMLNLGNTHRDQARPDKAQVCYEKLLACDPQNAGAWNNLATALQDQDKLEEAEQALMKARTAAPANAAMRYYLGLTRLSRGKLDEGWKDFESRFFEGGARPRGLAFPRWSGEELAGRSLLVWGEQGIGDELLFSVLAQEMAHRTRRCVLECAPKIVPLFTRSFPNVEVVARTDPPDPAALTDIDFQIPSGDLARWLRPTLASFPQHDGYLVPDPTRVAHWRDRLARLGPGLKVGFCWRSSLRSDSRHLHFTGISDWGGILTVPGVHFVNLQYDKCDAELDDARRRFGVALHAFPEVDLFDDLDEAAALTRAMDFVISAPTAASFLAAALGVPTWMMNYATAWQTLGTDHFPWFPAMRYYKRLWNQPWEDIIAGIADDLRRLAGGND